MSDFGQTVTRVLWPEVLVVADGLAYLLGVFANPLGLRDCVWKTRLLALAGLCSTAALLFLGLLSPYYGVIAVFSIPAPILFSILIFAPGRASNWPKVCAYLTGCVSASVLVWGFQIFWELRPSR